MKNATTVSPQGLVSTSYLTRVPLWARCFFPTKKNCIYLLFSMHSYTLKNYVN
jgi:hypothetical protein